jgi:hypothetical protein
MDTAVNGGKVLKLHELEPYRDQILEISNRPGIHFKDIPEVVRAELKISVT